LEISDYTVPARAVSLAFEKTKIYSTLLHAFLELWLNIEDDTLKRPSSSQAERRILEDPPLTASSVKFLL
jgi:hypothetical protein